MMTNGLKFRRKSMTSSHVVVVQPPVAIFFLFLLLTQAKYLNLDKTSIHWSARAYLINCNLLYLHSDICWIAFKCNYGLIKGRYATNTHATQRQEMGYTKIYWDRKCIALHSAKMHVALPCAIRYRRYR